MIYELVATVARLAQAYTFSAYGELLSIHGSDGMAVPLGQRLSSLGYQRVEFGVLSEF